MSPVAAEDMMRVINHVFLPPQLPNDADAEEIDALILDAARDGLGLLKAGHHLSANEREPIDQGLFLLSTLAATHADAIARNLVGLTSGQTMCVHVKAQNAAVLITRKTDLLVFEHFKLSPENHAVYSTNGRLVRTFPAAAVAVDDTRLRQSDFAVMIANSLTTMSTQSVPAMQPKSKKSGRKHTEERDTTHPAIVSELFFGMLRGIGRTHESSTISKNTRDEVLWGDALRPWRRSPVWLLVRVALQLTIPRSANGSHVLYKKAIAFIMSHILHSSQSHRLPSDLIYIMNTKIDQRRQKLLAMESSLSEDPVMLDIGRTLQASDTGIADRWAEIQAHDARKVNLEALESLKFEEDTAVTLPALDQHIRQLDHRLSSDAVSNFMPSTKLQHMNWESLPILPSGAVDFFTAANVQQFEQWVAEHLDQWRINNPRDACAKLCRLMKDYHRVGVQLYTDNPEGNSVMLLTILELWKACDQAALDACPLLNDYADGIPTAVLQNFLLPSIDQMERLSRVEQYLVAREARSTYGSGLLFDLSSDAGFANRFYDHSPQHQMLRDSIVSQAEEARAQKLAELQAKMAEYDRWNALHSQHHCEFETVVIDSWCDPPETQTRHSNSCQKCRYASQRDGLSIMIFEWPLPARQNEEKTVIFELDSPEWFVHWRETRMFVLHEVLKGKQQRNYPRSSYKLCSNDPHLTRKSRSVVARIGLLSEDKPAVVTHYRAKRVVPALTESEVCVPNGLRYRYYDSSTDAFGGESEFGNDIVLACTYTLPIRAQALQRFILRPASAPDGEPPNAVIAASSDACPDHMTLEEYRELSTLPLGHRIQWSNIRLQLAMPGVDFKKPETVLVILQCIYQAGPRSEDFQVLRKSHADFLADSEALSVLEVLESALQRIKKNWESAPALGLFVAIATRVLSLNAAAKSASLRFLKAARNVAFGWIHALRDCAFRADDHREQTVFTSKSVEVALICACTFNVDDSYLDEILETAEDTAILVQASIVVHEGSCTRPGWKSDDGLLHLRFQRLLHRSYQILGRNQAGFDAAIKEAWPGYVPGTGGWVRVAEHWLTTTSTPSDGNGRPMRVDYNLISGELLVDGLPLNTPPQSYRKRALYKTLFGRSVVEVMPSSSAGFTFTAKGKWEGCTVQLGMFNGQMTVRATKNGSTFETMPSSLLQQKYPRHFLEKYVLWYSLGDGTIELRPIDEPWRSNHAARWTLRSDRANSTWKLMRDGACVLGLGSQTAQAMSRILEPLAEPMDMHCVLKTERTHLEVDIPSLRLGFQLREKSSVLLSREYRPMAVDHDQSLGTLIGFSNKLVLKSPSSSDRMVLILESSLTYRKHADHVLCHVSERAGSKVHALGIDGLLHRLQDNGDIGCRLYVAYLHALTSHSLPDPLLRRTGTEQALTILRSKATESFEQLSQSEVDLLSKISDLSPSRRYYPAHERVMQQVGWDHGISFMSQHGDFPVVVSGLMQISEFYQIFSSDTGPTMSKDIEESLRSRDAMRSSIFRVFGSGAEHHTAVYDVPYAARDRGIQSPRALKVATMSGLFFREGDASDSAMPRYVDLWSTIQAVIAEVHGPLRRVEAASMCYQSGLLETGYRDCVSRLPSLHRWLKNERVLQEHKFGVGMWLSTLAFADDADMAFLQVLVLAFKSAKVAAINPPQANLFEVRSGLVCKKDAVRDVLERHGREYESCPEFSLPRHRNEPRTEWDNRRRNAWRTSSNAAIDRVSNALVAQWRCEVPTDPNVFGASNYIDMASAMVDVRDRFQTLYNNTLFKTYLEEIQEAIDSHPKEAVLLPIMAVQASVPPQRSRGYISEGDIFAQPPPSVVRACFSLDTSYAEKPISTPQHENQMLRSLIEKIRFVFGHSPYEAKYLQDLDDRLDALIQSEDTGTLSAKTPTSEAVAKHLLDCKELVQSIYETLAAAIQSTPTIRAASEVQRLPRISPALFLRQLAHDRYPSLSQGWRETLVGYGLALTAVQRAERLVRLACASSPEDLLKEFLNFGHTNWDPLEYPEWLLVEVESGIMIREVQQEIADEVCNPSSNSSNAVMQLNMGEGKSSVIVPISAARLANGSQLVRVITGKPQSRQMAQMLISKFGGLVHRRVYYMPFSRSVRLTTSTAEALSTMLHECMRTGGILLVQPEHILSFQLMALESYSSGHQDVGKSVMRTLDFLDCHSRDIVDESDDNFSVRFELVYTMGVQQPTELSPDRWFLLQQVLEIMRSVIPEVLLQFPDCIELTNGPPGSFPRIRILAEAGGDLLTQFLAKRICETGLLGFQVARESQHYREAICKYITQRFVSETDRRTVEEGHMWTDAMRPKLLVLRGLLACGVLAFAFGQKRWRVDYGFASTSRSPPTRLAVPYRAKDSPAPRSEFSHPDVVMVLTSLSYYYHGLDDDDLFTAFQHIMNSDQRDMEYQEWIKDSDSLPTAFRQLQGVNLKDKTQCIRELFPSLRKGKAVVDYFLSHFVFPKEMKEFPHKLSASGWDLGKRKPGSMLTTGFSGTNDSRELLPLDVAYLDLPNQKHTNATVLRHLLKPENSVHVMPVATPGTTDAGHLLKTVRDLDSPIQVILDVGAQILELDNLGVAQAWLEAHPSDGVEAVVFVDNNHDICVVDRQGRVDLLRTSSYQSRMDSCLVFLDEAHTRGIDLKLPHYFRAAVTCGPRLTKDRLVQACMRLRKLGHGQTVIFCVPDDVLRKIRQIYGKPCEAEVDVSDILAWSISETFFDIRRCMPLWALQGERFVRHDKLWTKAQLEPGHTSLSQADALEFLEQEAQTIEDRYHPSSDQALTARLMSDIDPRVQRIAARCQEVGDSQQDSAGFLEEQERELSPEVEQERQIQRAPPARPAKHRLHSDVEAFARTGTRMSTSAYCPAFSLFSETRAQDSFAPNLMQHCDTLLATRDYWTTIAGENAASKVDAFVRPVQWVLTSRANGTDVVDCALIISPYEANKLYDDMKTWSGAALHVYKPRVNSGYASMDTLNFHTRSARDTRSLQFPRSLAAQLNMFSGQLYLTSYDDYLETCKLLGLSGTAAEIHAETDQGASDDAIDKTSEAENQLDSSRRISFLNAIMSVRRPEDNIAKTDVGALLDGKVFGPRDFDREAGSSGQEEVSSASVGFSA
ncbi:Protein of unknown function (DUF3645) [Teratosphaeria destructans]|uniref:ubiquitinyl hydrolase 1 n=1 Tax=Teratosphaeria destructans TaxID=418781 RepID=A0A9W7W1I1_9PEZI|nr:Protein of unknown function (DUF3645) [Teratosphaeria destructans]